MIQTFKIIKGIEDIPSERFFKVCKESSTRGHSLNWRNPDVKQQFDNGTFLRGL